MQILRWSAAAALAAMVSVAPSFANDEMSAMKASMDNMKIEMEAMRSQLAAEREALRANAGGAPEALTSAKGNATIRIGGDVRFQYSIGWNSGYGRTETDRNGLTTNYRTTDAGWRMARAKVDFDINLSCDTSAYVALRFDNPSERINGLGIIDEAYWKWNNVGGSGFGLKVGLFDQPFGMGNNTDNGGWDYFSSDRAIITDPFAMDIATSIYNGYMGNTEFFNYNDVKHDTTNFGVLASYNWDDQFVLQAGIMGSEITVAEAGCDMGINPGSDRHNENRNLGFVNHIISLSWNPCWLEGLHLEAAYKGSFDNGRGISTENRLDPFASNARHVKDSGYMPSFDFGVVYNANDALAFYGEAAFDFRPMYYNGFAMSMTAGVEYKLTEKLSLGGEFDWAHYAIDGNGSLGRNADMNGNLYRLTAGARYDFGNGLYVRGQYMHDFSCVSQMKEGYLKPSDVIMLETGFAF